jgi:hypothetical protein
VTARCMIEAPHTKERCLTAAREVVATGTEFLAQFEWGCFAGVHNGPAFVEGESESAVRDMLPLSEREKWSITEVTEFTPEQIAAYH